nr:hypothetical protein [Tanacetum cinerariifolium]
MSMYVSTLWSNVLGMHIIDIQNLENTLRRSHAQEKVQFDDDYNVFATERQHFEQPESINNTCVVEKVDSYVIHDSLDMCNDEEKADQDVEDERVVLANLISNLKFDIDENKKIQKQLKKANASLTHKLKSADMLLWSRMTFEID